MCDASGNQDQIFIDQVTITGIGSSSKGRSDNLQIVGYGDPIASTELDIKLYPNPVKGTILNVEVPDVDEFTYEIKNMVGQTILKGESTGQVRIQGLEAGMYFIEINDGDEIVTKRFIRN